MTSKTGRRVRFGIRLKCFQHGRSLRAWIIGVFLVLTVCAGIVMSQREYLKNVATSYLYGYPLVLMDLTRDNFTRTLAPTNRLLHAQQFPAAAFREVVRPNMDTLYSTAWLDLSVEPMVFEWPALERYHVMQFLDAWTNVFASVGTRTIGSKEGRYLVVGPGWTGAVPDGVTLLRSPTSMVWLLGRLETHGRDDIENVVQAQRAMSLTPWSLWREGARMPGISYQKPDHTPPAPLDRLRAMSPADFFSTVATLMEANPPSAEDAAMLDVLKQVGIRDVGQAESLRITLWDHLRMRLAIGMTQRQMQAALTDPDTIRDGWRMAPLHIGRYKTDYGLRAVVAEVGIGANLAEDAVYPNASLDGAGEPLDGRYRYRLHFPPGKLPPSRAFWSVTAYDQDGFLIDNPIHRYALGDRDALVPDADGGVTLYFQSEAPEEAKRANWLPVPVEGPFSITARLYWPDEQVLRGRWWMPPIQKMPAP